MPDKNKKKAAGSLDPLSPYLIPSDQASADAPDYGLQSPDAIQQFKAVPVNTGNANKRGDVSESFNPSWSAATPSQKQEYTPTPNLDAFVAQKRKEYQEQQADDADTHRQADAIAKTNPLYNNPHFKADVIQQAIEQVQEHKAKQGRQQLAHANRVMQGIGNQIRQNVAPLRNPAYFKSATGIGSAQGQSGVPNMSETGLFTPEGQPTDEFLMAIHSQSGGNPSNYPQVAAKIVAQKKAEIDARPGVMQNLADNLHDNALTDAAGDVPVVGDVLSSVARAPYYLDKGLTGAVRAFGHVGNYLTNKVGSNILYGSDQANKMYAGGNAAIDQTYPDAHAVNEGDNPLDKALSMGADMIGSYVPFAPLGEVGVIGRGAEIETALGEIPTLAGRAQNTVRGIVKAMDATKAGEFGTNYVKMLKSAYPQMYASYFDEAIKQGHDENEASDRATNHALLSTAVMTAATSFGVEPPAKTVNKLLKAASEEKPATFAATLKDFTTRVAPLIKSSAKGGATFGAGAVADKALYAAEDGTPLDIGGADVRDAITSGFLFDMVKGAVDGHGIAPKSAQAHAAFKIMSEPEKYYQAMDKMAESGEIKPEQAAQAKGFLQRISPTVQEGIKNGMKPVDAIKAGVEKARLQETADEVLRLSGENGLPKGVTEDAVTGKPIAIDPKTNLPSEEHAQELITRLSDLKDKAAQSSKALQQLQEGTALRGRTVSGEEMAKLSSKFTPANALSVDQATRIAEGGPYHVESIPVSDIAADELTHAYAIGHMGAKETMEMRTLLHERDTADAKRIKEINTRLKELQDTMSANAEKTKAAGIKDLGLKEPEHQNPIVLDGDGNVVDGKKRLAYAIASGQKTVEVARPLTMKEAAETITDSHDAIVPNTPAAEAHYSPATPQADHSESTGLAKTIFQTHLNDTRESTDVENERGLTSAPVRAMAATIEHLKSDGLTKPEIIDAVHQITGHAYPDAVIEKMYNENAKEAFGVEKPAKVKAIVPEPQNTPTVEPIERKVSDLIGKDVEFNGQQGKILQDEGGKLTFENDSVIHELTGDETAKEIKEPVAPEARVKVDGDKVSIDGKDYEFVSTNMDKDGNVVSVTLKTEDGKTITKRDPDLALEVGIAKNNDAFDKRANAETGLTPEQQTEVSNTIDAAFQKEFEGMATNLLDDMPEVVDNTLTAFRNGIVAIAPNELQLMIAETDKWIEDTKQKAANSKSGAKEKAQVISELNKLQKQLAKYYEKVEKQRLAQAKVSAEAKAAGNGEENKQGAEPADRRAKDAGGGAVTPDKDYPTEVPESQASGDNKVIQIGDQQFEVPKDIPIFTSNEEGAIHKEVKTEDGETIPFNVFRADADRPESSFLQREDIARGAADDYASVERQFAEYNGISFTSGKTKIESYHDVAWLFRNLENEAVEHTFVVHVKPDGSYMVQHLGSGGITSAVGDPRIMIGAAARFGTTELHFVHNHPSGNLTSSPADRALLGAIRTSMPGDVKVHDGIIINLRSGRFITFSDYDLTPEDQTPQTAEQKPVKAYSFSKQVFVKNYHPVAVTGSETVGAFISSQRFGIGDKPQMLILNNKHEIIGKVTLSSMSSYDEVANNLAIYGGVKALMFGNAAPDLNAIESIRRRLRPASMDLLDYVQVKGDNKNFISAVDAGLLHEPEVPYGTKESSPDYNKDPLESIPEKGREYLTKKIPTVDREILAKYAADKYGITPDEAHAALRALAGEKPVEKPADIPTPLPDKNSYTAIKNAVVDEERASRGLPPAMQAAAKEFGKSWDEAVKKLNKEPNAAIDLINELSKKSRPLSDVENALMLHRQVELQNQYAKVVEDINSSKTPEEAQEHRARLATTMDDIQQLYDVGKAVGTENARGLAIRRLLAAEDYSLPSMLAQERAMNNGKPLSEDAIKEIEKLHEKIATTQKAFDDYVAKTEANRRREKAKKDTGSSLPEYKEVKRKSILDTIRQKLGLSNDNTMLSMEPAVKLIPDSVKEDIKALASLYTHLNSKSELVDKVHADLAELFPNLTKDEVEQAVFARKKPIRTEEAKNNAAMAAVQKSIDEYQRRINEKDLSPREKLLGVTPSREVLEMRGKRDELKRQYQDMVKEANKRSPEEVALEQFKKRAEKRAEDYKNRPDDYKPKEKTVIRLDDEAMRLQAAAERAKSEFTIRKEQHRRANMSKSEQLQDQFVAWQRAFKLSGGKTLGKLTAAAFWRIASTPIEEAVGGLYSKLLPKLAANAPREGGFNIKAESTAVTKGFMRGIQDGWRNVALERNKDANRKWWEVLKYKYGGKSDLEAVYGKEGLPAEAAEYFGHLHSALKATPKRIEFERSFQKRIAFLAKQGVDVSDPLVQTRIGAEAYKDANRAIFMQDNAVADFWKAGIQRMEQINKLTGKPRSKELATLMKWLVPFVKVPTNIIGETVNYSVGLPVAAARLTRAMFKGLDTLKPHEAESVLRLLKKGSLGAGLMLMGYFNPQVIGGFYVRGMHKKDDEPDEGGIKLGGLELPKFLLHNPLLETLQIGATIRKVQDHYMDKDESEMSALGSGVKASLMGVAEQIPFSRLMEDYGKLKQNNGFVKYLNATAASTVDPALLQEIARWTDTDEEGKTIKRYPAPTLGEGTVESIETGIPGLRQNVSDEKQ